MATYGVATSVATNPHNLKPRIKGPPMPHTRFAEHVARQLDEIARAGLLKSERIITTPQDPHLAPLPKAAS